MIRVLHVLGALDRGGAETMIMNIYRNIDRSKIQFDFIIHTKKECAFTQEIVSMGGRIFSVPKFNGINLISYCLAWNCFFKEHTEYHIIHGHMRSTAAIYLKIAKMYGLYAIAHSHNTSSGAGIDSLIKDILQLPIRKIADFYFACSKEAGIWLFGNEIVNSQKFVVLPNAIDVEKYHYDKEKRNKIRQQLGLDNMKVFGHVGRFHPQKNHEFIIKVFQRIHSIDANTVLILIGKGDEETKIRWLVNTLGLKNSVFFLGERNDVPDLLQAMDIFLFPSLYEGLGIVAIEAEATGLNVVCSKYVPHDVELTDYVYFADLVVDEWIEIINHINVENRKDNTQQIRDAGYDIKSTSNFIQQFYIERNCL